jgi:hypothetical protein
MPNIFDQIHAQQESTQPQGNVFDQLHAGAEQDEPGPQASPRDPKTGLPTPQGAAADAAVKAKGVADAAADQTHYALSDFISKRFLENVLPSAGRLVGSMGSALMNIPGTANNIADIVSGTAENLGFPRSWGGQSEPAGPTKEQQMANAAGQYLVQRHGSYDNIKRTAFEDPVGFVADIASVLGGGGAALRGASGVAKFAKFGRTADILSGLGKYVATTGDLANPTVIPTKAGSAIAQKPMTAAAKSLYQGALKPPVGNGAEENAAIVQAGLGNSVPLNQKAPARAAALVEKTQQPINETLQKGRWQKVDPMDVAGRAVGQFRPGVAAAANSSGDLRTFDANIQDYLQKHAGGSYPAQEAQAEKVATYRKAATAYGKSEGVSPEQTATKALGFGLKDALEQFFPELKGLNEKEGAAIGLQDAIDKFAAREGNRSRVIKALTTDDPV